MSHALGMSGASGLVVLPDGGFPNIHGKLPVKMIGEGPPGAIKRQKRGDGKAPA